MAKIIDGKQLASQIRLQLKEEVHRLAKVGIQPGLAVLLVGDDPASLSYVKGKEKGCNEIGIYSELIRLPQSISEDALIAKIKDLNNRSDIHGILVQLPLPNHIREKAVIDAIDEAKDVDGFTPRNVGNLVIHDQCFLPCTPHGIIELIKSAGISIEGKHAVIVGRSNIVGKPVALLLLQENATVTICHSRTPNLAEVTQQGDILVVAVGKEHMIGKEHIKPGAVVIDVGVNRTENGKLVGDVNYEEALDIASYITPVPGGVGPMTITMLLKNTVLAAKYLNRIS